MKVPSPEPQGKMIGNLSPGNRPDARNNVRGPNAFATLFEDALKRGSGEESPPGEPERLLARLELIRARMNEAIVSAFSDTEEDSSSAEFAYMLPIPDIQNRPAKEVKTVNDDRPDRISSGKKDLDAIIDKAAAACGVDKNLIAAVIRAESGFDAEATSPRQAMGLMQLMPETARELGVTNAYDPEQNVMAGARYLKGLLDRYNGDVKLALAAYNWGMGNLENGTGGLPAETRNYIAKIMRDYGGEQA